MMNFLIKFQKNVQLFTPYYLAFRSAIKRAEIELPDQQLLYVLRYTFVTFL